MPIEIRELIIRAEVDAGGASKGGASGGGVNQDEIVQEVVDKVLNVLNQQKER